MEYLHKIDELMKVKDIPDDRKDTWKGDVHNLWAKVRGMVDDLHWKTIKYLTDNYSTVIYPDFRISEMVKPKKGKKSKIGKGTKRMMYMYSFHKFKQRLAWKCKIKNTKLIIVDESFTSKTCGKCGELNNVGRSEVYECSGVKNDIECGAVLDRDANGARNILLKHL